MKKRNPLLFIALTIAFTSALCGCSNNKNNNRSAKQSSVSYSISVPDTPSEASSEESSQDSTVSIIPQQSSESSKESSTASQASEKAPESSSASQASAPVSLPAGVSRVSKGKLRYTSSVLSLNAVFPEEFCILDTDYIPRYGIYLQNAEGTATLLAESFEDTTLTYRQMSDYLKNRYPDARVYTTDQKDVICRMTTTDQSGNEVFVFQRIKVKNGG